MKVNIRDKNFGHDISSCANTPSKHIEWVRDNSPVSTTCFITDLCLHEVVKAKGVKRKVAWILEPRSIHSHVYDWIEKNNKLFDFVLTFDETLIKKGENYLYYPHGRCWIKTQYDNNENHWHKLTNESFCSIFDSGKSMTTGHKLRHTVVDNLSKKYNIDCFGQYTNNRIDNKEDGLNDFKFSITIENEILPGYWTEKLLDCFATLTYPIYWGDRKSVSKYFDEDGIIFFNNINELDDILYKLTNGKENEVFANSNYMRARTTNYNSLENYRVPEDWIFNNYPFLFDL